MRLLLDENVPRPLHQVLTSFVLNHDIVHLLDLPGWSGTRDETLYPRAAAEGFHVVLTNDGRQMQRPREVAAGRSRRTTLDHLTGRRSHGGESAAGDRPCAELAQILAYVSVARMWSLRRPPDRPLLVTGSTPKERRTSPLMS
ncbi:PIN-like domain-containing protein [Nonomuraea wenchangensis]